MDLYTVNFRFDVSADSQEEANAKVEDTMKKFARYMDWEEPDKLLQVQEGQK
jgi:hypothetical protein